MLCSINLPSTLPLTGFQEILSHECRCKIKSKIPRTRNIPCKIPSMVMTRRKLEGSKRSANAKH